MSLVLNTVLIIDEMPMIAAGFRETMRSLHPPVKVEHVASVFTALSARAYDGKTYDLVILGSGEDHAPGSLLLPAAELKARFPGTRVMIYTDKYDPLVIDMIGRETIDACIHKHEDVQEIRNALEKLRQGETFLSPMLYTLYSIYRLNR